MDPREPFLEGAIKLFAVECRKVQDGKLGLCLLSFSLERKWRGGSDNIAWDMCLFSK